MLKMNDDKTEFMVISSKQMSKKFETPSINVGCSAITPTTTAQNIGAIFDSCFSLDAHVSSICKSAFYQICRLGKVRKFLNQETAEQLTHAFITSRLDINNGLLYGLPSCQLEKLQRVQNTAARIVSCTGKYEHITPVLKSLHWLPVASRIKYKLALLVFKIRHNLAPQYLGDLIHNHEPSRALRSSDMELLTVPRTRTLYGDRAFSVAGPKVWNSLPFELRNISDIEPFKNHLKTFLFKEHFGSN